MAMEKDSSVIGDYRKYRTGKLKSEGPKIELFFSCTMLSVKLLLLRTPLLCLSPHL